MKKFEDDSFSVSKKWCLLEQREHSYRWESRENLEQLPTKTSLPNFFVIRILLQKPFPRTLEQQEIATADVARSRKHLRWRLNAPSKVATTSCRPYPTSVHRVGRQTSEKGQVECFAR
jgi:hypothetical protein